LRGLPVVAVVTTDEIISGLSAPFWELFRVLISLIFNETSLSRTAASLSSG